MEISKQVVLTLAVLVLTILAIIIRNVSIKKHCPSSKDTTSNLQSADPYCSSTSSSSPLTWDVFLSFHGKDTRNNFTSHLYSALNQAGIRTFKDDHALEKGQEISPTLLDAIRNSNMFIVVLSENYARSRWCLDELAEILKCDRTINQVVPVFYYVDPSDVRHQKGSFGKALDCHKKRCSSEMIVKWKSSLSEIAKLTGHHLRKEANEDEADIIQKIVGNVAKRAFAAGSQLENLFGIDSAVEEIYQRLSMDSNDVRAIGICGMGGIGKTTIAKTFYNKNVNKFKISCFCENVEQYSHGVSPLLPPLEQLLVDLLRKNSYKVIDFESKIRKLKQILHSKKALIVLDDLDQSNYSELLASLGNFFSSGSKIIITTRDANLLNKLKADISEFDTYMVKTLGHIESLELFSYHAFRKPVPPESFTELSLSFVTHAGGLPLALKVLGSSLLGRSHESFWKDKLEKVRAIPENDIQKILQLSYDGLEDETQKAIFLDIAFFFIGKDKDEATDVFKSCDFFPRVGIPNLADRCLLTIDECNRFQMHNLIRDMGRELGKTTRLFLRGNAWKDLQNAEPIKHLNYLGCLYVSHCRDLKRLPEQLGDLKALKKIDASFTAIQKLPDSVIHLKELAELNLRYCERFRELPEQLGELKGLKKLDAHSTAIKQLPDSITRLKELGELKLRYCSNLTKLPEQLGEMWGLKNLDAAYSAIKQLPDSVTKLKGLVTLELNGCENLIKLPEEIGNMEGLKRFTADDSAIEELPDSFGGLINLVTLRLSSCKNLRNLPNSICNLKLLEELYVNECLNLEQLPEQLGKMQCLEALCASNTAIERVPDSIGMLRSLQSISLLPSHLLKLSVRESSILHDLPDLSMLKELQGLWLIQCNNLKSVSFKPSSFPFNANLPNREVAEWVTYKSSGHTVSFNVPPSFGSNFLGLALWVVFTCKSCKGNLWPYMKAVITNETEGVTENYRIDVHVVVGEAQSRVQYITGEKLSMKSGDRIKVSFPSLLYKEEGKEVVREEVKEGTLQNGSTIKAVGILSKFEETSGTTESSDRNVPFHTVDEVQSRIECISRDKILVSSGDTIVVTFQNSLYCSNNGRGEVSCEDVHVEMCGAYVIQETLSPETGLKRCYLEDDLQTSQRPNCRA
ncbi:hypothetical protein AgCh_015032 [Apium graveolens]